MYQDQDDQESITSVARIVVNRIRSKASEDRKELEKKLEDDKSQKCTKPVSAREYLL